MNEKVEEQPQPNIQITIQDLMVLRSVIDAATKGGVLAAGDLTTVGMVHDKVHVIIEEFMAKQKEAQEERCPPPPLGRRPLHVGHSSSAGKQQPAAGTYTYIGPIHVACRCVSVRARVCLFPSSDLDAPEDHEEVILIPRR